MLSIGEFSKICEVTTKTLRYYEEIGLIYPAKINQETGYRYYAIEQMEKMLFINRLKKYGFSLDEIKEITENDEDREEVLYKKLLHKKQQMEQQLEAYQIRLGQLDKDLLLLQSGKPLLSYLDEVDVQLAEVPTMCLLSQRLMVQKEDFPRQYQICFGKLFEKITKDKLTMAGAPMVLFHSSEFTLEGMDTEFAIPVKEYVTGTRNFAPGLCLKTVIHGTYENLSSVYAKQIKYAEEEGYQNCDAVFEVYVVDPSAVKSEAELVTEVYHPVKKI